MHPPTHTHTHTHTPVVNHSPTYRSYVCAMYSSIHASILTHASIHIHTYRRSNTCLPLSFWTDGLRRKRLFPKISRATSSFQLADDFARSIPSLFYSLRHPLFHQCLHYFLLSSRRKQRDRPDSYDTLKI